MKKVRVGLIGLGFMGTTHFGIYKNLPQAEVVAIADVDPAKRKGDISKVVGNIGGSDNSKPLDLSGIKIYEDAMDLINDANVDMVDICVPTPFHASYICAALANHKHVFGEKPLCRNLEQLTEIENAVKKSDKFFNVGMCIRAWPEYFHAKNVVDSGKFGKVKSALFRRLSPDINGNSYQNWFMSDKLSGGAALDLHLHDTDVVCFFFGQPKAVRSNGARGLVSDNGIDHIITSYVYDNGMFITAEGGWAASKNVPFEMSFQIICEKATLKLDAAGYHIYHTDGQVETPDAGDAALPTGWHQELNYFTNCILSGEKPIKYQTNESIFAAFKVVMAEIESVDSKKEIEVKYV